MELYKCNCCKKKKERLDFYKNQFVNYKTYTCIACIRKKALDRHYGIKLQKRIAKLGKQLAYETNQEPIYTWDF